MYYWSAKQLLPISKTVEGVIRKIWIINGYSTVSNIKRKNDKVQQWVFFLTIYQKLISK